MTPLGAPVDPEQIGDLLAGQAGLVLAGALIGLAASTKYTGALLLALPAFAVGADFDEFMAFQGAGNFFQHGIFLLNQLSLSLSQIDNRVERNVDRRGADAARSQRGVAQAETVTVRAQRDRRRAHDGLRRARARPRDELPGPRARLADDHRRARRLADEVVVVVVDGVLINPQT